jgi:hypothetical protein
LEVLIEPSATAWRFFVMGKIVNPTLGIVKDNLLAAASSVEPARDLVAENARLREQAALYENAQCVTCARHLDELAAASSVEPALEKVIASVSDLRAGEENDGPLESTDLWVHGRGISLLVNVRAGGSTTYSLIVDGQTESGGYVGAAASSVEPARYSREEFERDRFGETGERLAARSGEAAVQRGDEKNE